MYEDDRAPTQSACDGKAAPATSREGDGESRLLRERAAAVAHYKKMYDRSSALASIGVWECDLASETLTWTDGVYDLFELPRGSPIGRDMILSLYDEESRREMERLRALTVRDGGSFSLDIHIRTAKGNERWIRLTADVERENGRSVRVFGTKQDITAEKSAQEEVRALQARLIHMSRVSAMGTMAATLAHELNQPLAAIANFAAGTRRALDSPEPSREFLERGLDAIEKSVLRAGSIIRSLRDMNNGSAARRQPLDPNPLILEAASLAMLGAEAQVDLRFDLADDVMVSADPIQIQQVVINLIRNAVDAVLNSPRREISVSTRAADGVAQIRVDDSGNGIAPELLDSLFDSFVSSKRDGMGVGLSVSRTIVEAHEGKLSAANREGGGASFCVALPLAGYAPRRSPIASTETISRASASPLKSE
jgi:C4-dicarboxylate-specific signal transduction histidine kinase